MRTKSLRKRLGIAVLLILGLVVGAQSVQATGTTVLVDNLQASWTAPGGGGVFAAYVAPPAYGYVSPGTTAVYDGREAGIIKAGLTAKPDGHYDDEGLFGFKPDVTIDAFAAGTLTYDVQTQYGENPVWMTIEIDTGTVGDRNDNTTYQHVPTANPAGWQTVDAGAGQWQKWNNNDGDVSGNPLISLSAVATAHTGLNVVRAYLRLGMGDSYHGTAGLGTVAWVDMATLAGVTYDFVVPTYWYVAKTGADTNEGTAASPFLTIQKAVDSAAPTGDTIHVAAGAYADAVNINKSLTLQGAQYGVNVSGRTAASAGESTIQGLVTVDASNVVVDGFTLTNPGQTYAVSVRNHTPSHSTIAITHNIVDNVGAVGLGSNVHAIVLTQGPDSVTIAHNRFNNIKAAAKSVSAVGVLDSASTDSSTGLVIEDNTFTDIASTTKGAYGVIINNKAGAPGAQIKDNTFSNLSGGWTHAIGLETDTLNVVVTGNTFSNLTVTSGSDNVAVWFESNPSSNTVTVASNKFNGAGYYGVLINAADVALGRTATAENNWWGSACGPSATGIKVGTNVDYSPWWTDSSGGGTASEGPNGLVIPAGATTAQQEVIIGCSAGRTVTYAGSPLAGGVVVSVNGVTIDLNGATIGHGSPAYTIVGDDVTVLNGILDGDGAADPGVLVTAGADNFALQDSEVREWANGVEVAGNVTSLKIVDSYLHDNTGAGLKIDSGVTIGGVINVYGNLFKVNGGNGIQNDGVTNLPAQYNSWGDIDGSASGTGGDGVSSNADAGNPTFIEYFMDVDPETLATSRRVAAGTTFDVKLKADGRKVNGIAFKLTYNAAVLQLNSTAYLGAWAGASCLTPTAGGGVVEGACYLTSGEWNGDVAPIMRLNFTVLTLPSSPYSTSFDILSNDAVTNAGAYGGAKVYVNNAGFGAPSVPARDISDTHDGELVLGNLANYTGFVDLQGRASESGATLLTKNVADKATSISYASGTSASGGAYTTAHLSPQVMFQGETYWFQFDRALYLPTTQMGTALGHMTVPTTWQHSKVLSSAPTTALATLTLIGGDATDDNVIDVLDAGCLGASYHGSSTCTGGVGANSDVTGDGVTDILDLSLMGGNYYKVDSPWAP